MRDVICFGGAMIRLSSPDYLQLEQPSTLAVKFDATT